jgi:hypothetical protein
MNFQIFILSMFLIFVENFVPQQVDIAQIEFTTYTRGYHKTITITQREIVIAEQKKDDANERVTTKKNKKEIWNKMIASLHDVSLSEIPSLASPTMKRASDAARSSTITLTTKNGNKFSHSFDNENSNEKLKPLMMLIHLEDASR